MLPPCARAFSESAATFHLLRLLAPFCGKKIWLQLPGVRMGNLSAQDKIIASQTPTIAKLQDNVERLAKGYGHPDCLWRGR